MSFTVYPAIDVIKSGTRKEELLYHPAELEKIYLLRQGLADLTPVDAMNLLTARPQLMITKFT